MKYKYEFRFIELANGAKVLVMDLPKDIELVSAFLTGITGKEDWYIRGINDVLFGKYEYQERDGEFYGLEIRKDLTKVHDVYGQGEECTIETRELLEIIEIWINECSKLRVTRGSPKNFV